MRIRTAIVVLAAVATGACASRSEHPNDTVMRTEMQLVLAAEDVHVAAEVNRHESAVRRLVDDKFAAIVRSPHASRRCADAIRDLRANVRDKAATSPGVRPRIL